MGKRSGCFAGELEGVSSGKLFISVQPIPERLPVHKGQDVVEEAVGLTRFEEGQDMGVGEPGRDLDLAQESFCSEDSSQLRAKDFYSDRPVMLDVLGEVHGRHAPSTDFPLDGIAVGEGGFETVEKVRHYVWLRWRRF